MGGRCAQPLLIALTLTSAPAWAQEEEADAPTEEATLDELVEGPVESEDEAPQAKPATPEATNDANANQKSLDALPYVIRASMSSLYSGSTLIRAERHGGHYDVWFKNVDGKHMMAEVRPDGTLGKVEESD